MVITPNQTTKNALCRNSHGPAADPVTASITPVPMTPTEVTSTNGPSRRSSGAGGPWRRYPGAPL